MSLLEGAVADGDSVNVDFRREFLGSLGGSTVAIASTGVQSFPMSIASGQEAKSQMAALVTGDATSSSNENATGSSTAADGSKVGADADTKDDSGSSGGSGGQSSADADNTNGANLRAVILTIAIHRADDLPDTGALLSGVPGVAQFTPFAPFIPLFVDMFCSFVSSYIIILKYIPPH
jgi:hypothetical protein